MNTAIIVVAVILLGILLGAVVFVLQKLSTTSRLLNELKEQKQNDPTALLLKEDLKAIHERMDRQTESMQKSIQSQFGESAKIIERVTERLTKLDE
ncbi:MAG: hypothetical protein AAB619_01225, partial [Patescibacteria group bacterium]